MIAALIITIPISITIFESQCYRRVQYISYVEGPFQNLVQRSALYSQCGVLSTFSHPISLHSSFFFKVVPGCSCDHYYCMISRTTTPASIGGEDFFIPCCAQTIPSPFFFDSFLVGSGYRPLVFLLDGDVGARRF